MTAMVIVNVQNVYGVTIYIFFTLCEVYNNYITLINILYNKRYNNLSLKISSNTRHYSLKNDRDFDEFHVKVSLLLNFYFAQNTDDERGFLLFWSSFFTF